MQIPPGLVYLSTVLPGFIFPPIGLHLALQWAHSRSLVSVQLSLWVLLLVFVSARLCFFFGKGQYVQWRNSRDAARLGAELPSRVPQSGFETANQFKEMIERGYPAEVFLRWTQTYGDVVGASIFTNHMLVTHEPSHVKVILATQFDTFGKSYASQDTFQSLFGTGIFNSNGEMWKFHRGITRPFFTRERISDFEIYERNSAISLKAASERLSQGYSIDIQDLFGRFTLDSATEFLFGQSVDSLSAELPFPPAYAHLNTAAYHNHPSNVFVEAFTHGLTRTASRAGLGAEWRLFEFAGDKVKPMRKVMDEFVKPMIERALKDRETGFSEKSKAPHTVLASLVDHTQDEQVLKDELVNLLVAGRDTTMSLLAFSIYMITQNPGTEDRLRQEILNIVGPTGAPDYSQIREMKYLRAFLNEVLRLYPVVPVDSRMAFQDTTLPSTGPGKKPIFVPKNTECVYSVLNMQRRTDLWGPDALVFDPDRFIDERLHKYLTPNPFIFCPFNAGPRICLGQQFAYHEASYYLIRLLQKFSSFELDSSSNIPPPAEWAQGEGRKSLEKIHPAVHLTMYVKGGLWVRMKEYKHNISDVSLSAEH
ncbi:cytochrome P450 monooxygenase pc-3 [Agrocybe pediades]|nr:cytochrome P450 monooxygenase pc-3 [Agrocybe pediades]